MALLQERDAEDGDPMLGHTLGGVTPTRGERKRSSVGARDPNGREARLAADIDRISAAAESNSGESHVRMRRQDGGRRTGVCLWMEGPDNRGPDSGGFLFAGVVAEELDPEDWRSHLRAELAQGGGLERLTQAERLRIDEGRSFEGLFNNAVDVHSLAWELPDSKCEIKYAAGDPNPWCRCTTTIPASVDAVLEGLWEIDGDATRYDKRVKYRALHRASVHSVDWTYCNRVVPLLPPFEWHTSVTWAQSTVGGQKEISVVFVPLAQTSLGSESHAASTRQLALLIPDARANTTQLTVVFQVDYGSQSAALERLLPNMRVEIVRRHRSLVASIKNHFQKQLRGSTTSKTTLHGARRWRKRYGTASTRTRLRNRH